MEGLVEADLLEQLGHAALDDAGDDVADEQDDQEAEHVREEPEEAIESLLEAVADLDGRKKGHERFTPSSVPRTPSWPWAGWPSASRSSTCSLARVSLTSRSSVTVSLSRRTRSFGTARLSMTTSSSWSTT